MHEEQRQQRKAGTGHTEPSACAADVGRWFATASTSQPHAAAGSRGLPRTRAWGPDPRGGYGETSPPEQVRRARAVLGSGAVAVLTGAGMSTGSGLPDYRGADATPRSPMTFQEFTGSDLARRRYWARSTVGWEQFSRARPNRGHRLLAQLTPALGISQVITQNVDGLHQAAGSPAVIDLHGRLERVRCLSCGATISRSSLHERLLMLNPQVARDLPALAADAAQAPDGDAEVDRTASFRYPPCAVCGGVLKPDVVFFGESARPEVVAAARQAVAVAGALLVLGSSLSVFSGLRFVRQAVASGIPVVIVNDGPTRGDDRADVRVAGRIEDVLEAWETDLRSAASHSSS